MNITKKYHVIKVKNEFHTLAMPGMIAVDVMELAASTTSYRLFITQEWAMLASKLLSEVKIRKFLKIPQSVKLS